MNVAPTGRNVADAENSGIVPLILGITGHRNPSTAHLDQLSGELARIFTELRQRFPHTPLKLISPLAEGADRIVAKLAVENGVGLIVPLAWPADICQEQLHRSGNRGEFDHLVKAAEQVIELPLAEGITQQSLAAEEDARNRQYQQVGAYVARHSQILIALWDGVVKRDGGTSRVITWQQQGALAPYAANLGWLDKVENGPVFHVHTPREGETDQQAAVTMEVRYPTEYTDMPQAEHDFSRLWGCIEEFNADVLSDDRAYQQQVATSKDWCIPEDKCPELAQPLSMLLEAFARADAAAIRFQKKTNFTLKALFLMVVVGVGCFEFYAHLFVDSPLLLVGYIALLFGSICWYWFAVRRDYQRKYLDYRGLAEALRVQLYWRIAGLTDSVADHYLRNLRSELDWIRQALRACHLVSGGHQRPTSVSEDKSAGIALAKVFWIDDQFKYFSDSAPKNERIHKQCTLLSFGAFWSSIALACILLWVHIYTHHLHHGLVVAVFVLATAAALFHEYTEKQACSIQAKRYDWMRWLFHTAQQETEGLLKTGNNEDAQSLILELGKEALAENAEWVLQRRERPIMPPHTYAPREH